MVFIYPHIKEINMNKWLAYLLVAGTTVTAFSAEMTLVENGTSRMCVVVPANPSKHIQWAGEDLALYIGKSAGQLFRL